jgi:peptidoglycan/xylan/chitin deacetylase (PgdA/CDA1 family)
VTRRRFDRTEFRAPRPLASYSRAVATRARSRFSARPTKNAPALRILMYHRIAPERDLLAVTPDDFRRQMDLLAGEGYAVADVAGAWKRLLRGETRRLLALTFDDGYRDFRDHAAPVLADHGFGATVFVCPGLIEDRTLMSWYRDPPPLLSWDDIASLESDTVRFEPHCMTHPNLTALELRHAAREVEGSRQVLEDRLRRPMEVFCYPAGLAGPREHDLVRDAGLSLAVTCQPGVATSHSNPLALPRTAVQRHDRLVDFKAKLDGLHDKPLPGWALYQRLR